MKSLKPIITILFLFIIPISLSSQSRPGKATKVGPQNGSLVIVGGGRVDDAIFEKFIELAGGPEAPIVVVPTAAGMDSYDENAASAGRLRSLGAKNVSVLHTTDREIANSDSFVSPLLGAKAVWFGGGRQWRLVDAYKGTRTGERFYCTRDSEYDWNGSRSKSFSKDLQPGQAPQKYLINRAPRLAHGDSYQAG